jgi:hypothetical protein
LQLNHVVERDNDITQSLGEKFGGIHSKLASIPSPLPSY